MYLSRPTHMTLVLSHLMTCLGQIYHPSVHNQPLYRVIHPLFWRYVLFHYYHAPGSVLSGSQEDRGHANHTSDDKMY